MEDPEIAAAQEKSLQEAGGEQQLAEEVQKTQAQAVEEADAKEMEEIAKAADEANE